MDLIFQFTSKKKLGKTITMAYAVTGKTSFKNIVNHQHLSSTEHYYIKSCYKFETTNTDSVELLNMAAM